MDGAGAVLTARWHLTGGCRHGCPLSRDAKALGSRPGERWAAVPRGTAPLCGGRVAFTELLTHADAAAWSGTRRAWGSTPNRLRPSSPRCLLSMGSVQGAFKYSPREVTWVDPES